MQVTIETRTVGQKFGTIGIVRALRKDGRPGRELAAAEVRPYGFDDAARQDAANLAESNGWTVVDAA